MTDDTPQWLRAIPDERMRGLVLFARTYAAGYVPLAIGWQGEAIAIAIARLSDILTQLESCTSIAPDSAPWTDLLPAMTSTGDMVRFSRAYKRAFTGVGAPCHTAYMLIAHLAEALDAREAVLRGMVPATVEREASA